MPKISVETSPSALMEAVDRWSPLRAEAMTFREIVVSAYLCAESETPGGGIELLYRLGRQIGISRTTVIRYFTGRIVPHVDMQPAVVRVIGLLLHGPGGSSDPGGLPPMAA